MILSWKRKDRQIGLCFLLGGVLLGLPPCCSAQVKLDPPGPLRSEIPTGRIYGAANPTLAKQPHVIKHMPVKKHRLRRSEAWKQDLPVSIEDALLVKNDRKLFIHSETKVFFPNGHYHLNSADRKHLDHLLYFVKQDLNRHRLNHPDEKVVLMIEIKGYADTTPFYQGQSPTERQRLNRWISERRAHLIGEYMEEKVASWADHVVRNYQGLGEKLPPGVTPPQASPKERRVGFIQTLLYSESPHLYDKDYLGLEDH